MEICKFNIRFIPVLVLLWAAAGSLQAQTATLYYRMGGMETITAAVDDLVDAVAKEARAGRHLRGVALARLKASLANHLCAITGGPCVYSGESLEVAHAGMAISEEEFEIVANYMDAALIRLRVPAADRQELHALLSRLRPEVIGK